MKDKLVLLALLTVLTNKVESDPYEPDSNGSCRNSTTVYLNENTNLCCQKCPAGHRLKQECSKAFDTQCEPCGPDQFIETWNFSPNCLSCTKCKKQKGLEISRNCTPTSNSKCVCKPDMFCQMGFDNQYCTDCVRYTVCKTGFRVSVPGTPNSDVKCERCPTTPCQPRTTTVTTTSAVRTTAPRGPGESTQPVRTYSTMGPKTSETGQPTGEMVAVTAAVAGFFLFLIGVILLLILCKRKRIRDSRILPPKVDANGNCETQEKNGHIISGESLIVLDRRPSPEQIFLLGKGEVACDQSLSSSDTETSIRADGFSSHESLRPLQPTLGLDNPTSALSEPLTLHSITESMAPPLSTQSSSQPTSPQIVSPVTNSPHVNVNITLHIGNGSCGTPSFQPADFNQADFKIPFGQEEESVSTPQQEAGKLAFMSVQESPSYCT